MRRRYALPAIVVLAATAIIGSPGPAPGATAPGGETLTLEPDCSFWPPSHSVLIKLTGFQPHTQVTGSVAFSDGGGFGPATVETDDNGNFSISLGTSRHATVSVNAQWSGGTLAESLAINCGGPNGTPYADPGVVMFPDQELGYFRAPDEVTVTNDGPGALRIFGLRLTGTNSEDFLIASDSCSGATLGVGDICFVRVRFGPSALGIRSADLEILSSTSPKPYPVDLQGEGVISSTAESGPQISGSVRPQRVRPGERRCFEFRALVPAAHALARALVRFAGEKARTDAEGTATICKSFPYPGTRTARIRKLGYRSVLLRIQVSAQS